MVPDFWHKFIGASCLHQKLANLKSKSEALGFGRNNQHGAATSKSRNDTSVGQNVHISIRHVGLSASWTVGELVCWRVVRLPSRGIGTFRSPVFSFLGSKVPSGNLRSQEQKFPGTFAPGNRHSWPRTTKFSTVNCGKRHVSRRQLHPQPKGWDHSTPKLLWTPGRCHLTHSNRTFRRSQTG